MRRFLLRVSIMCVAIGFVASLASAVGQDIVVYKSSKSVKPKTAKGTIEFDRLRGIKLKGISREMPRHIIIAVLYEGSDTVSYKKAIKSIQAGNYSAALKLLNKVGASTRRMADDRKKLIRPHIFYNMGLCYMRMGNYKTAIDKGFLKSNDKKSPYYFESELAIAKCKELMGTITEAKKYFYLLYSAEFSKLKSSKSKYVVAYAGTALLKAESGVVRCEIKDLCKEEGNDSDAKKFITKLEAFAEKVAGYKKKMGKKLAPNTLVDVDADMMSNKASLFKYLKKYSELVGLLNTPIRKATAANNRAVLASLYLDRADAYYGMMEAAEGEAKAGLVKMANFEYFRVTLGYDLKGQNKARAFYRLGELLIETKPDDWKARATRNLKKAKAVKDGGNWRVLAGELIGSIPKD